MALEPRLGGHFDPLSRFDVLFLVLHFGLSS
jgi:hypothetical protein